MLKTNKRILDTSFPFQNPKYEHQNITTQAEYSVSKVKYFFKAHKAEFRGKVELAKTVDLS